MAKVLVLGGNNYFGKKLVQILIDNKNEVTLLNRGNKIDGFEDKVQRIICDRHDKISLEAAIEKKYDIIFDQCCFDYEQAKMACEVFNGKVGKYLFTSSISVYDEYGANINESQFDPHTYKIQKKETMESNYGEAKRQAEVSFYKYAKFPVTAIRFPIVLDENDTTQRLQFHVKKIKDHEEIYFSNINAKMSFISASDAALALYQLSQIDFAAPINVASSKPMSLKLLIKSIETITNSSLIMAKELTDINGSSYNIEEDWYADCSTLEALGIELEAVDNYLPKMIKLINEKLKVKND